MKNKTYSIFGAGAAGLYTARRLLDGKVTNKNDQAKQLSKGNLLELYDWGKYDFSREEPGTRAAGARVCTWHYKNDKKNSYLELGGMRYSDWDGKNDAASEDHAPTHTTYVALATLERLNRRCRDEMENITHDPGLQRPG